MEIRVCIHARAVTQRGGRVRSKERLCKFFLYLVAGYATYSDLLFWAG